ncbi:MAG TPA: histidinol-phosphate transaminase [Rhizomicrobium sp.]|nr:histidinol-phosphate transaminase [Rhizomicrobium sp.]
MSPIPKPGVLDITPYVGGRGPEGSAAKAFKLSSNESPFGPSPAAREAYARAGAGMHIYPEGSARILREALAETHGLSPDRIVCGNGSDDLLTLLADAYLRPGDEVVFSEHAFLIYKIATLANSAVPVVVPETNLRVDVDAMLGAIGPRTRVVYLANPNNPTGTYLSSEEVRRLHAGMPPAALLVIDAAYAEYVRRNDYDAGMEMVSQFANVVMTRTFSKVYGLAGLRVGWAFCPAAVADVLNRIRGPFNVSVPAQAVAAAALRDRRHLEQSVEHNEKWRGWLTDQIRRIGLRVGESVANFVLIHFPETGPHSAKAADAYLSARGLVLRSTASYGLPHCLRMTVGLEEANRSVVEALAEFIKSAA